MLLRFAPPDEGARKKIVKALAPLVAEGRSAALLVLDDAQLAARAGADGVHIAALAKASTPRWTVSNPSASSASAASPTATRR